MPPIFYLEVRNKSQDFSNATPLGNTRTVVTRYFTEFNPTDPETILERLENEDWINIDTNKTRELGIRPRAIEIDSGNWELRVDWRVEWEEFDETELNTESILGLTLYNVRRNTELPSDRTNLVQLASEVWGTPLENAAHIQKLGKNHKVTTITGKVVGRINYADLYEQISNNRNIVECKPTYNRANNTTSISIRMEDSSDA